MMDPIAAQAIDALAAIDAELGIPENGRNNTQATIAAIRALKAELDRRGRGQCICVRCGLRQEDDTGNASF